MFTTRKAFIWEAPGHMSLKEIAIPALQAGEALVRVESCALCGSDLRTLHHGHPRVAPGQIVGHEISGVVCDKAQGGSSIFAVGDRISVGADVPCMQCAWCLSGKSNCCDVNYAVGHQFEGGFTEYMVLNRMTLEHGPVRKLHPDTDFDAAALAEPLACCINGYERSRMESGGTVVVFGAGPIGLLLGLMASLYEASAVILIDPKQRRLDNALRIGAATHTVNPDRDDPPAAIRDITDGRGGDMIFTACPAVETHAQAVAAAAKQGVVNFFGGLPVSSPKISLHSNEIHYRELRLTGSHGSTPQQHKAALELIESGKIPVERLIAHSFPLEHIEKAYLLAEAGEAGKLIIKPHMRTASAPETLASRNK
jgi:L-iditol 2-dehydrogenase